MTFNFRSEHKTETRTGNSEASALISGVLHFSVLSLSLFLLSFLGSACLCCLV